MIMNLLNENRPIDSPAPTSSLVTRPPEGEDAAAIWRLVRDGGVLDANSPYAYLLLCTHFAATGRVAFLGPEVVGFVLGYRRPDDPNTAFVWQVGVAKPLHRRGLAGRLLDDWLAHCARSAPVHFVEATVTPSNRASRALFEAFANRHELCLRETVAYPRSLFPEETPHDEEIALRIGPLDGTHTPSP